MLYLYGNDNGDIFNFDMAGEMEPMQGDIHIRTVIAADDTAGSSPGAGQQRSTLRVGVLLGQRQQALRHAGR